MSDNHHQLEWLFIRRASHTSLLTDQSSDLLKNYCILLTLDLIDTAARRTS